MFLIFLFIVILLVLFAVKIREGGGPPYAVEKIEDLLKTQQKEYLYDIKNGDLIFALVPDTFNEKEIFSFPLIKYFYPYEQLQKVYEEIKTTVIDVDRSPYVVDKPRISNLRTKFCGEWLTITKGHKGFFFTSFIDYFQEECRMQCQRVNAGTNFITFFEKNKNDIAKKFALSSPKFGEGLTYLKIVGEAFKRYEPCSEFNPVWLTNLIPLFEKRSGPIHNMLDMSAGRGARMVACAAKDINYLGIDPCECAHKNYQLMKKFVEYCGTKSKIEFVKSGFEEAWEMPESFANTQFDLMFTSPPYFDLEIYEDTPGQSIKKFTGLENWLENFLKVCMIKTLSLLRPGGIMAMNIDNPVHIEKDYVGPMLNFKFDNAEYIGVIRIWRGAKFHTWCWQKSG